MTVRRKVLSLAAGMALFISGDAGGGSLSSILCWLAFATIRDGDYEVYKITPGEAAPRNLTKTPGNDNNPSFSRDGKLIAFDREGDIYLMNADGSNQKGLTKDGAENACPVFSSRKRIAFQSRRDGNFEIYVLGLDKSKPVNLTRHPGNDACPAFSPDGKRIAFVSDRDGRMEIYVMDADGTNQRRLTKDAGGNMDPAYSPDGKKLAFTSNRDGNFEIYLMDHDGSNQKRLTFNDKADVQPVFSPDGRWLAYERDGKIYGIEMKTGKEQLLLSDFPYQGAPAFGPCRKGK